MRRAKFYGFIIGALVALNGQAQAGLRFEPDPIDLSGNGNLVGQENLLGTNQSGLLQSGSVVQGYVNQSMGVMNISGVGGDLSLTYSGGQATVDLNSTATGVAFEGAPGPFPANTPAYKPIFSFTSISFELGWDFPGTGTSANGTGEIQITVEYLKKVLGGFAATPAKTVSYIVPPPPNGNRFLVQATDGDIITKVTVEAFSVSTGSPASFLDSVNQIRIGGDSDRLPPIVIQGDIVPEPTSLALAGFAGIGMAVGAIRRRRQQKSQAA